MLFIKLSREDPELAKQEIATLGEVKDSFDDWVISNDQLDFSRLTYSNEVFVSISELPKINSFKIEHSTPERKKKLADRLKSSGAKVNLSEPEATFMEQEYKGKEIIFQLLWKNKKEFLKRHPKNRPAFHPGACLPKLARVMCNLVGKDVKSISDPFCGTGGILIEGFFLGLDVHGSDLDEEMIEKSKRNLEFYKINTKIGHCDALESKREADAIVTELPFGLNTKLSMPVQELYDKFLAHCKELTEIVCAVVPDGIKYEAKGWKVTFTHAIYIHKSLSKRIVVLRKLK